MAKSEITLRYPDDYWYEGRSGGRMVQRGATGQSYTLHMDNVALECPRGMMKRVLRDWMKAWRGCRDNPLVEEPLRDLEDYATKILDAHPGTKAADEKLIGELVVRLAAAQEGLEEVRRLKKGLGRKAEGREALDARADLARLRVKEAKARLSAQEKALKAHERTAGFMRWLLGEIAARREEAGE